MARSFVLRAHGRLNFPAGKGWSLIVDLLVVQLLVAQVDLLVIQEKPPGSRNRRAVEVAGSKLVPFRARPEKYPGGSDLDTIDRLLQVQRGLSNGGVEKCCSLIPGRSHRDVSSWFRGGLDFRAARQFTAPNRRSLGDRPAAHPDAAWR